MSTNSINGATDRESLTIPLLANSTSQVAIVGASVCPIESLDYEIAENDFFKQDWRTCGKIQIFQYLFMKWLLCFLIGIIVSLIGFFNNLAVENIAGIKFVVTSNMMLLNRYGMAFLVFSVSNLVLTLFASIVTAFVAPAAAGSGIPEVKAYLNGVDAPGILSLRTLVVKGHGAYRCMYCIIVGVRVDLRNRLTGRWLLFFKNDRDRRDLVTCGSAAGIAAAFRAPVGGVLFALEEMASWWRSALLWRAFFTTAVVAIVLRALIDLCLSGKCGLFGVVGGILGSLYNFLLDKVLRIYNLINEKGIVYRIFLACSISIFTSSLLFGLPWLASCQPCPADASEACPTIGRSGNYKKFQCQPGHYNDLASLIFNTNDDAIRNLFSRDTDAEFQYSSILIFFITCFFLSIFSYGIVAPAGLFVPVIVTGASYGRFVGMVVSSKSSLNHGLYAVLGAASFLGGSMRMTVSLCVIILELTNNLLLLPLIMLVLLVSKTVADAFNGNIYDLIMKAKGFPYLETHAEPYMRQLTVTDVVTGPLQLFHGIEKVGDIVHVLQTTRHNGFPVIDEPPLSESPVLYGLILRAHLIELLKKKVFSSTPVPIGPDAFEQFLASDFAKRGSGNGGKIEDIEISEEEMEMFLDLHPFTNTSPYTVVETMSLAKARVLFREVGLRHLLVIPKVTSVRTSILSFSSNKFYLEIRWLGHLKGYCCKLDMPTFLGSFPHA
ncbi:hypothetical protein GH714_014952 [Hevea brasiliensis]|uniref:Chloride channel protein n=1 Tax=Hevea brasiliensis TaxID=3981 RepID=A0A6A6MBE4_HEVBR|nr:hypothetical protein GH714_014952 [Hevea brasiliensis]